MSSATPNNLKNHSSDLKNSPPLQLIHKLKKKQKVLGRLNFVLAYVLSPFIKSTFPEFSFPPHDIIYYFVLIDTIKNPAQANDDFTIL